MNRKRYALVGTGSRAAMVIGPHATDMKNKRDQVVVV